jgi:AcrR family transcriptional regulator
MKVAKGISGKRVAGRGRPRAFDPDRALDRATAVFWKKGYEGASLDELTRAMRINRPSLYAAFGNKASLFRRALARYESRANYVCDALTAPTARAVAARLLHGAAESTTRPGQPRGCLMVQAALTCGDESAPVRRALCSRRAAGEAALRARFERAKLAGDLPRRADPADLARYIVTVVRGMSVQAAGGATREQLHKVADTALRAWPA